MPVKIDESGNDPVQADESSVTKQNTEDIMTLKEQVENLSAELEKANKIKEKLVNEQQKKSQKHTALKDEKNSLEIQLANLQDQNVELLEKFTNISKEFDDAKNFREAIQAEKKAELEVLKAKIPEEKRSLIIDNLPVEKQLDFIKKNAKFLLGSEAGPAQVFGVHRPEAKEQAEIKLSSKEVAICKKINMDTEAALDIKSRNPKFFETYLKK